MSEVPIHFADRLVAAIDRAGAPVCIGLDPVGDRLPAEIGMTPIMRPYVIRDTTSDGQPVLSALTMIAESHVSLHVFPREERAYFDIFSCRFFDRSFVVPRLLAQFPGGSVQEALVARGSRYRYLRTERADEHAKSRTWLPQR